MQCSSFSPVLFFTLVLGQLNCSSELSGNVWGPHRPRDGEAAPPALGEPAPAEPAGDDAAGASAGEMLPEDDAEGLMPNDIELGAPVEPPSADPIELTTRQAASAPVVLDCGPDGWAVESAGPPDNRVNYVILADGYGPSSVDTTLEDHIRRMLDRRFGHESGEPYGRYRKFVNICVMKVVSEADGIGNGPTAFDGGNGGVGLARVNAEKVNAYLDANLPEAFEVDWRAVVLNQVRWENTGAQLMLWSGGTGDAPGAALHEGGHGFHQLADEYCQSSTGAGCGPNAAGPSGDEFAEVNSSGDPMTTGGKWDLWLGSMQKGLKVPDQGATGLQGAFAGSRNVDSGQYRPSSNSMMNSLFGSDVSTSFNSVSREQMIFSIWRAVRPIDSTDPPAGELTNPASLSVNVIDPDVIAVDWEVDGELVAQRAGGTLNLAALELTSGSHTILARAYDGASDDLVRNRTGECPESVTGQYCQATAWLNSTQTVQWTISTP